MSRSVLNQCLHSKKNSYPRKPKRPRKPIRKPKNVSGRVSDRTEGFREYLLGFRAFGNPLVLESTHFNALRVFYNTLSSFSETQTHFSATHSSLKRNWVSEKVSEDVSENTFWFPNYTTGNQKVSELSKTPKGIPEY